MTIFGRFSLFEAESAEIVLKEAGIASQRQIVEARGLEYVEILVDASDFDDAADIYEAHVYLLSISIDLSGLCNCPRCGGNKFGWFAHPTDFEIVELLFCQCSGDEPLAMRDRETRIGRYLR